MSLHCQPMAQARCRYAELAERGACLHTCFDLQTMALAVTQHHVGVLLEPQYSVLTITEREITGAKT